VEEGKRGCGEGEKGVLTIKQGEPVDGAGVQLRKLAHNDINLLLFFGIQTVHELGVADEPRGDGGGGDGIKLLKKDR
jgi:hypothetical protein